RGRGPSAASYREAMTKMTMGGAEVQNANGVRTKSHGQPTLAPKAQGRGIQGYLHSTGLQATLVWIGVGSKGGGIQGHPRSTAV
ncbi:MAG: hypothetical protein J6X69_01850, partial [Bacteroidales bacterium]|nr:hypothetical protein [Bacteroidales bacterium]